MAENLLEVAECLKHLKLNVSQVTADDAKKTFEIMQVISEDVKEIIDALTTKLERKREEDKNSLDSSFMRCKPLSKSLRIQSVQLIFQQSRPMKE